MKHLPHILFAAGLMGLAACSAPPSAPVETSLDGDWSLSGSESHFAFVTVKAGTVAEAHTFSDLSGFVHGDGTAEIEIPLATVETNIDVRNERMRDFLFETGTYPVATVTAQLDPAVFAGLSIGDSVTTPVSATLDLHGQTGEIETNLVVTRIGSDKVQVATATPIIVHADDYALGAGVEKLRELANLPAITPSVPVTFSIVLTR